MKHHALAGLMAVGMLVVGGVDGSAVMASPGEPTPRDVDALVDAALIDTLRAELGAPLVGMILQAQNLETETLTQDDIDRLDAQWRAERDQADQPIVGRVLSNPLSIYLTQIQARSLGAYSEIFVMDAKGLNVGQSAITSDYWQGDEAKFQNTFPVGANAVFVDAPEYHAGTATWRVQVNLSLGDGAGQAIGAATVELNLTELRRRRAAGL